MQDTERLRRELEVALRETQDARDVLPRLHRLARHAPEGSDDFAFAHRHLAELLVERAPWRAALHARKATATCPDDDGGWAALGLCHTLLGNFHVAASAYRRALECAPSNPWYAHNLGHLLDVALGRAGEALPWLRRAYEGARRDGEVALSYAHALARAGQISAARTVLRRASRGGDCDERQRLLAWLEAGAMGAASAPDRVELCDGANELPARLCPTRTRLAGRRGHRRATSEVGVILERGLARLPLFSHQRARAREIAKDVAARHAPSGEGQARVLAAAAAYAAVCEAGLPLTQSEVAATFRVSAASLRGRLTTLRGRLARARPRRHRGSA